MAAPVDAGSATAELRGSRCPKCGVAAYPAGMTCPRCAASMTPTVLADEGILWTWTVQRFAPKSPPYEPGPGEFEPFAVGYVELPDGVRIEAIIDVDDLDDLRIDMPVRLTDGTGVPHFTPAEVRS